MSKIERNSTKLLSLFSNHDMKETVKISYLKILHCFIFLNVRRFELSAYSFMPFRKINETNFDLLFINMHSRVL